MRSSFDPDAIPPDYELAEKHKLAQAVGVQSQEVCPCCGYFIMIKKLPLMINKEDLTFLGSGYPLYFAFIKNCIFLLCLHLMAIGQLSLITNYYGQDCESKEKLEMFYKTDTFNICIRDEISLLSLANNRKQNDMIIVMDVLAIISAILMMLFLLDFRRKQKKLDIFCDLQEITPSDYTIMVYQINDPNKLKEYFEHDLFGDSEKIKVTHINLAYELTKIEELEEERAIIIEQKKKAYINKTKFDQSRLQEIDEELHKINQNEFIFAGVAFISFKYESQKDKILRRAKKRNCLVILINTLTSWQLDESGCLNYYGNEIRVIEAPEPTDIDWHSIQLWEKKGIYRKIIGTFISIVANVLLSIVVYIITMKQFVTIRSMHVSDNDSVFSRRYIMVHLYSLMYSIMTVLINSVILVYTTRAIVYFQVFPTYSKSNMCIASTLSFMMFLNSCFIQCLLSFNSGYVYSPGGLLYNLTYFFISNCFIAPLIKMIDFDLFLKKLKILYYKRFGAITQIELNQLFQYPEHRIEDGYADIMKTMNVAFFVGPLLPIGYIFSIIGLIIYYWVEKYALLRQKTVLHYPSFELSSNMTNQLQLIPIIYLYSNFLFKLFVQNYISFNNFVAGTLALFYHFMPNDKIVDLIWDFQERIEYAKYDEMTFQTNYDRENPVTKREAIRKWISREGRHKQRHFLKEDYATLQKQAAEIEIEIQAYK